MLIDSLSKEHYYDIYLLSLLEGGGKDLIERTLNRDLNANSVPGMCKKQRRENEEEGRRRKHFKSLVNEQHTYMHTLIQ